MAEDRSIGALRLRVPDERVVPRAVLLVEDALRTASLPPTGGRLVVIRRLDLGRLDLRRPSVALADRLRELLRGAWSSAVHGARPEVAGAEAAWFLSAEEAHAALLVRLLRSGSAPAWPWRRAVPLAFTEGGVPEVRRALASVRRLTGGTVALARVVDAVARAGALAPLLDALMGGDGAWLVPELEDLRRPGPIDAPALLAAAEAARRWPEVVGWLQRASPKPTELRAVAALALMAAAPARGADPRLVQLVLEVERTWRAALRALPREEAEPGPRRGPAEPAEREAARRRTEDEGAPGAREEDHGPQEGEDTPRPTERRLREDAPEHEEPGPLEALARTRSTRLGGLLFLLGPLARLGLLELLEREPRWFDAELGLRVLRAAAERLGWPDDDPLRSVLAVRDTSGWAPERFVAPAVWWYLVPEGPVEARVDPLLEREERRVGPVVLASGPVGRCPEPPRDLREGAVVREVAVRSEGPVGTVAEAWVDAIEAWLLRHAELTLADVVLRPARVLATSTHVDLLFGHGQADARLRRVGLDLDPGWVAWWGRVVAFHYRDEL